MGLVLIFLFDPLFLTLPLFEFLHIPWQIATTCYFHIASYFLLALLFTDEETKHLLLSVCVYFLFIFFSIWFFYHVYTFTIHRTAWKGGGYLFKSSSPLPTTTQARRHQPGNYCRELTSAHSQQPDSNQEPLISERKSLTTKLHALLHVGSLSPLKLGEFRLRDTAKL